MAAEASQLQAEKYAPEGGATLAGAIALQERGLITANERVVLLNTGAGWLYRS